MALWKLIGRKCPEDTTGLVMEMMEPWKQAGRKFGESGITLQRMEKCRRDGKNCLVSGTILVVLMMAQWNMTGKKFQVSGIIWVGRMMESCVHTGIRWEENITGLEEMVLWEMVGRESGENGITLEVLVMARWRVAGREYLENGIILEHPVMESWKQVGRRLIKRNIIFIRMVVWQATVQ